MAIRYIQAMSDRMRTALDSGGRLTNCLAALTTASAEHSGAISFEQRIYDALDHVSEATKNRISRLYVTEVLDPVVDLFAAAVADGEIVGDPQFLMNAFLHLVRAGDLASGPGNAERIVTLFLDGARPR